MNSLYLENSIIGSLFRFFLGDMAHAIPVAPAGLADVPSAI